MIHSDQILDQINTPDRDVLFATSFGLSLYNGSWSTRHINRNNISEGLMDEFITAIEYDAGGNLWIGYSGGIQIYDGRYYRAIRDQQLLKDPRIVELQRWQDDIWIATGHAGIHRYHKGTWTWFQPMSKTGPGFYEVKNIALDPFSDILVITSADNGLWTISSDVNSSVVFSQIASKEELYGTLQRVKRDPRGGVYLFDKKSVVHYSPLSGFVPELASKDLTYAEIDINDLAAASDGKIYLATDDGIYIWDNHEVARHISRFEGIGTSEIVNTIFIDARNRVWFSTQGYVGFFPELSNAAVPIRIDLPTKDTPAPEVTVTARDTLPLISTQQSATSTVQIETEGGITPILDPILKGIRTILERLGLS